MQNNKNFSFDFFIAEFDKKKNPLKLHFANTGKPTAHVTAGQLSFKWSHARVLLKHFDKIDSCNIWLEHWKNT